jgi:hypothetical protein
LNVHAQLAQLGAEEVRIDVMGFSGQHLIANDDDTGGFLHDLLLSQGNDGKQAQGSKRYLSNSLQLIKK